MKRLIEELLWKNGVHFEPRLYQSATSRMTGFGKSSNSEKLCPLHSIAVARSDAQSYGDKLLAAMKVPHAHKMACPTQW
jgi:hypothetical protein